MAEKGVEEQVLAMERLRFSTSFWAEKKQDTFFRFPARCAAMWAAGI